MDRGLIISVSGPSGVGKGTVLAKVKEIFPEAGQSISVTTRNPRGDEKDGVEYYFRSKEEFKELLSNGEIIEYDTYVGNYYGTPAAPLKEMSSSGRDVLLDLTIEGSVALKRYFGEDAITVFLLPPSFKVLEDRLRGRGTEDEETIGKRMEQARNEVLRASEFDYIVTNDDLEAATDRIASIIKAEKLKSHRQAHRTETL